MEYVASPYTHPDPRVREHRFLTAKRFIVAALNQGMTPFSPIVYLHEIAKEHDLPKDADYWKKFNNQVMRRCESIFVLKMIGWQQSHGVQYEIMMAQELGLKFIWADYTDEVFPEGCSL